MPKTRYETRPGELLAHEVIRKFRVTHRQLQHWHERGVICPEIRGHRRVYGPAELLQVAIVAQLRRKGLSLQKSRRVLRIAGATPPFSFIVTDGRNIEFTHTEHGVLVAAARLRKPAYIVDVSAYVPQERAA